MKKISLTLLFPLSAVQIIRAEKLPDGTVVEDSLIKSAGRQFRQYEFNTPVLLSTPLGRKELKYISFITMVQ